MEPNLIAAALGQGMAPQDEPPAPPQRADGYILLNGHEFRRRPPNDPEFPNMLYCRRCGQCAGTNDNVKRMRGVLAVHKKYEHCQSRNRPESEWPNRPIGQGKSKLRPEFHDAFREKWCSKPVEGHHLKYVWRVNDLANLHSLKDYPGLACREGAGWLQCTRCEKSWMRSWDAVTSRRIPQCSGSKTKTTKDRTLQKKAYDTWKSQNRTNEHDIVIDEKLVNWYCKRCYKIGGSQLWKWEDPDHQTVLGVNQHFTHKVSTACIQHQLTEEIT